MRPRFKFSRVFLQEHDMENYEKIDERIDIAIW